jgi:hypothetical protein
LAEEAEKDATADSELWKGQDTGAATEAKELCQLGYDTSEAGLRQIEAIEDAERMLERNVAAA